MNNLFKVENIIVDFRKEFFSFKEKNTIFKLFKQNKLIYAGDFSGNILFNIELKNNSNLNLDTNIPHFVKVIAVNKNTNTAILEIHNVNKAEVFTDNLPLFYNNEKFKYFDNDIIMDCFDKKAILVGAKSQQDSKNDTEIVIVNPSTNKVYSLLPSTENSEKTNYIERKFVEIEKQIKKFNIDDYYFALYVGNIRLTTEKEYLEKANEDIINILNKDINNYLKIWEKYNEIEKVIEFRKLKNDSYIKVQKITMESHVKLWFDEENYDKFRKLKDPMLIIGDHSIRDLFEVADFKEYIKFERQAFVNKRITRCNVYKNKYDDRFKSVYIEVDDYNVLANIENGNIYICCSLLGSATMFKRREQAKNAIIKKYPLNTFFTDNPRPNTPKDEFISINYELVKDINLTENQKKAIEIICNTPDIAIIQGPPGTGKTTVINVAITQINNQCKKIKNKYANNLVSGFRHETVKNLTDKVKLYGLPALKVGEKNNEEKDIDIEPQIQEYIDELTNRLDEKYKDLIVKDNQYNKFIEYYQNLKLFYNTIESTIEILEKIKDLDYFKYDSKVTEQIDKFIKNLKKKDSLNPIVRLFLEFLYNLPLSDKCYFDNKNFLENQFLVLEDQEIIKNDFENIKKLYLEESINFENIKKLRRDLIIKYMPTPKLITSNSYKNEILEYLDKIYNDLLIDRLKQFDGKELAILNFKESLKENPYLIKETLLKYTKVLGSTNQQTYSKSVFDSLIDLDDTHISFDNVFIDEAATSSPLDLFIPMSVYKDRLVLVGDHKQLPHITDENIVDVLQEEYKDINVDELVRDTLFKYLINKARELEKIDGKQRVITLNNQFRMNPNLGNLISKHFYQEEGGLYSPSPETDFTHNYHNLNNKYLYWIDNKGDNVISGTSRCNESEAKLIAKHIKEAIDDSSFNNETIGVISFYRNQVKTINNALKEIGIYNDKYELNYKYRNLQLEVGTVDAFQGKEFDIVYLGTTYTSSFNYKDVFVKTIINDKNRLCVACSRQKKLLIVVGNSLLYRLDNARDYVSILYEINSICNGE